VQREFGLFSSHQHNVTLPGAAGQATIGKIMAGFRAQPPSEIGGQKVTLAKDYESEGEPALAARVRARTRIDAFLTAFLELAYERGQPR
jgi:hypothetical protein